MLSRRSLRVQWRFTVPEEFGRYELQDLLGRGGMGEVYRAFDRVRDRTVALKLLPKHLASDESFKARFRRESRMAARLNEPHIIPIHDFGEIDGTLFIDMRLVEGSDLGSVLAARGRLPIATAVSVVSQVASALDAAHASGLVHRDVKPSNVLLTGMTEEEDANPFAYLVDFGIARSSTQEGTALTATTGTVGTVAYMSPERIAGEHGDLRTDIYALACVLYETLTGRKPFDGELFAIMYAHVEHACRPRCPRSWQTCRMAWTSSCEREWPRIPPSATPAQGRWPWRRETRCEPQVVRSRNLPLPAAPATPAPMGYAQPRCVRSAGPATVRAEAFPAAAPVRAVPPAAPVRAVPPAAPVRADAFPAAAPVRAVPPAAADRTALAPLLRAQRPRTIHRAPQLDLRRGRGRRGGRRRPRARPRPARRRLADGWVEHDREDRPGHVATDQPAQRRARRWTLGPRATPSPGPTSRHSPGWRVSATATRPARSPGRPAAFRARRPTTRPG